MLLTITLTGCKNDSIPSKVNSYDNSVINSPINTLNLDKYMFRDDVQYVDLRSSKMILEEGYVAGFEFIPFYSIIASFDADVTLYQMIRTEDEQGNYISAGQVGGFVAQYEESKMIVESLFSKEKYIFFISQAGSESAYMINLLIQLGYDGNLLYNVGGVSGSEGIKSYKDVTSNKYYVSGHNGFNPMVTYKYLDELTPIE